MARSELGTDAELLNLVAKIKGFDHDNATSSEQVALAQAMKLIAQDTIARWEAVREAQLELSKKIAIADVAGELAGVLATIKPQRRSWRNLWG